MVGKPYVVAGKTYVPREGHGYRREGWASWYGTAFHGRLTANGEIFDRQSIAAAHPTLPLPSYVRVTNLVNKRSMIVRVNDRGPYERTRLIDVSERAAEALGFRKSGTGRVMVEYVGRASVNGSDDDRLLASLRTDGEPAAVENPRPVALAELPPSSKVSSAPRAAGPLPEYADRPPASARSAPSRNAIVASADDDEDQAPPLEVRPPRRPNF